MAATTQTLGRTAASTLAEPTSSWPTALSSSSRIRSTRRPLPSWALGRMARSCPSPNPFDGSTDFLILAKEKFHEAMDDESVFCGPGGRACFGPFHLDRPGQARGRQGDGSGDFQ